MIPKNEDRLLMSESLEGNVPDLEDEKQTFSRYEDAFLIGVLEMTGILPDDSPIVGKLIGIANEEVIKIDLKISLNIAYKIMKMSFEKILVVNGFQVHHGKEFMRRLGPFTVKSPRLMDIDHEIRACVIALDLVRTPT